MSHCCFVTLQLNFVIVALEQREVIHSYQSIRIPSELVPFSDVAEHMVIHVGMKLLSAFFSLIKYLLLYV